MVHFLWKCFTTHSAHVDFRILIFFLLCDIYSEPWTAPDYVRTLFRGRRADAHRAANWRALWHLSGFHGNFFSNYLPFFLALSLKKVRKSVKHSQEWLLWTTLWIKVKDVRGIHWLQLRGRSQDRSRSLQLQRRFQRHQPLQRRPRLVRLGQNGFSGRWHGCCEDYHLHHLLTGVRTGSRWELTSPVSHDLKENVEKVLHQPFRD